MNTEPKHMLFQGINLRLKFEGCHSIDVHEMSSAILPGQKPGGVFGHNRMSATP